MTSARRLRAQDAYERKTPTSASRLRAQDAYERKTHDVEDKSKPAGTKLEGF